MFGIGYRKDDGLPAISTANTFSALESRRRKPSKKKAGKDEGKQSGGKARVEEEAQIWVPAPITVKSWADVEEDDDYFASSEPLPSIWSSSGQEKDTKHDEELNKLQESEAEEEAEEEEEGEVGEEEKHETPAGSSSDLGHSARPHTPTLLREPDKQLSKKELKKKELAELDAVLAEFGLAPGDSKKEPDDITEPEETPDTAAGSEGIEAERKSSSKRRKAKKEKPVVIKENDQVAAEAEEGGGGEMIMEEIESNVSVDPKELLMKKLGPKKKKTMKENSSAASKVAAEAAARAAKLAAAKKKEKTHYNQQPAR